MLWRTYGFTVLVPSRFASELIAGFGEADPQKVKANTGSALPVNYLFPLTYIF
jgi:hypothetical protein